MPLTGPIPELVEKNLKHDVFCAGSYDINPARVVKVLVPYKHIVKKVRSEVDTVLTGADLVVTIKDHSGAAMTGGTLTIALSGTVVGDRDTATITAGGAQEKDKDVQLDMNGGPSAGQATFWIEVERAD